jgi:hypothetical protein
MQRDVSLPLLIKVPKCCFKLVLCCNVLFVIVLICVQKPELDYINIGGDEQVLTCTL